MKRFIRYLYEYEQGKRLRNVGFVKVEQQDKDCTLNIHGKGLHMKGEQKLDLYLFLDDGGECMGIWQGTVDNVNPAINYRLYFTEEDVISPENFQRINGIILESEMGRKYAAVWNDAVIDVGRMRALKPDETLAGREAQHNEGSRPQESREEETRQDVSMLDGTEAAPEEAVSEREEMVREEAAPRREEMAREEAAPRREGMVREEAAPRREGMAREEAAPGREGMVREEAAPENGSAGSPMYTGESAGEAPVRQEAMGGERMQENAAQEEPAGGQSVMRRPGFEEAAAGEPMKTEPADEESKAAENRGAFPYSEADLEMSQELTAQPIENICGDTKESEPEERFRCTKIQRNDIARLPRCEWKWANNSFLLHGYYNYHHLAIIDDGEKYRLGVPGIYHPQEAKAANTFGFTEFIPYKDMDVDLTDEEKSSQAQFGYWCRPIKRMLKA